ncbi:MAG TPA: hypothetical protein VMT57_00820 [Candidatus Thermoplasmatota archaeon]|nr:hypothetical protein [Candidatus Thermoplasmatota archaeon]
MHQKNAGKQDKASGIAIPGIKKKNIVEHTVTIPKSNAVVPICRP